jgi:hypothetical protein
MSDYLAPSLERNSVISDVSQWRRISIMMECQKGDRHGKNGLRRWGFKLSQGVQRGLRGITKIGINIDVIVVKATAHWKEKRISVISKKDLNGHRRVGLEYHLSLTLHLYSSNPSSAFFICWHFLKCKVNAWAWNSSWQIEQHCIPALAFFALGILDTKEGIMGRGEGGRQLE